MPEVREIETLTGENAAEGVKVAICIPSGDYVPMSFAYDLANLTGFSTKFVQDGAIGGLGILRVSGTYLHKARQTLAERAIAGGADYLFWLDSDMRFPKDALVRLLMHETAIVGCNYPKRGLPPEFVAIKRLADENGPGEVLKTFEDSKGLEEVEAMGFGCALMHADVFKSFPDPRGPGGRWFWFDQDEQGRHIGEDVYFAKLAAERGWKLYVDHDLSKELSHTGTYDYTLAGTQAFYEHEGKR